jgi:hypothetical protein
MTGKKLISTPSNVTKVGLNQLNSTVEKKDPELVKKEKLLKEIEAKNDEDSRKKLTVASQVDPMKNQTFIEMMKQITMKEKKAELNKIPLVEQGGLMSMPESIV